METIVALSTPPGKGGIAIVRLSGDRAKEILSNIFKRELKPRYMSYGKLVFNNNVIDEVMVCYMPSPHTYTREDIVEIYSHGNNVITNKIISTLLSLGAKLAEPGEFTKRAFLNGRIDLTQAEAIHDLINSKSSKNVENSLSNLNGFLRERVLSIKSKILDSIAEVNAVFDYPEEVEDNFSPDKLKSALFEIEDMIASYENGKKVKEGLKLALVGKPNVGKSSIMNRLLKYDKSIITDIPGTTRDLIEDTFYIDGYPVVVVDTAGIRESGDRVEQMGIELAKRSISEADLVLLILDGSRELEGLDRELLDSTKDKNRIIVMNKSDLKRENSYSPDIEISANKGEIRELEIMIKEKGFEVEIDNPLDNIRHHNLFLKSRDGIKDFLNSDAPVDIASTHLQKAINALSEIIGEISTEDILDNIFKNFCVGK